MYGLDINFLNDRPEYRPEPQQRGRSRGGGGGGPESRQPLILGLLSAVLLTGLAGGAWLFLQNQNTQLRERQAQLDAQLGTLKAEQAKLASITSQTKQIKDETAALASVFNTIKPWSATFNDISARIPPKVRLTKVKELTSQEISGLPKPSGQPASSPSPSPGSVPPPSGVIELEGEATSFDDVNDFLLVLKASKFLKSEKTVIISAVLGPPQNAPRTQFGDFLTSSGGPELTIEKLPPQVAFKIRTALTDVSASELVKELENKKATGLVSRIEALQQKGGVKP